MNIRMCIFSAAFVALATPISGHAQSPPPVGSPITTLAQAQFYALQMATICNQKRTPALRAGTCKCVFRTALNEAVTGSYAERWQMLWTKRATIFNKYVASLPRNQQGEAAFLLDSMPQSYHHSLEKQYQAICTLK